VTPPAWLRTVALVGLAVLVLPLAGMLTRVHWSTLGEDLVAPSTVTALWLSLVTAFFSTIACLVLGFPLAFLIARASSRTAAVLRAAVMVPLVLPPMVGGLALLSLLGRSGVIGKPIFEATGLSLPYTTAGVVVAQTFVAMPFLVITLEGVLRTSGQGHERVAASLGASRWRVLTRVTLPLVMPGLIAGTVLAFARAMGEFGATALFAGNSEGVTRTMPLAIYTAYNGVGVSQDSALALSLLLLVSAVVIVAGLRSWREEAVR
jgi:molybdate transport system permease protein